MSLLIANLTVLFIAHSFKHYTPYSQRAPLLVQVSRTQK
jgi:hypothetical protein